MFTFPVGFFNLIVSGGGGGTTDPFAANVVLFLKGDGTNGSTNIVDSSPSPKTITVNGNAQISTAQSKYGGSSLLFDGSGDYLTTTALNLVNIDFTVEYWIYVLTTKFGVILSSYSLPNQVGAFITHTHSSGAITAQNGISGIATPTITNNSWIHVAATYQQSSNQLKIYLNGVLSQSISVTMNNQHSTCWIGGAPNDNNIGGWWLHAYVDSLRVTQGIARYTANFNPETDTYLDLDIPAPTLTINRCLATNGGTVTASSTFNSNFPASSTINGDRKGLNWANGGGWNNAGSLPAWLEVAFSTSYSITKINVITLQDNYNSPVEPTTATTFSSFGVTSYSIEYWNGSAWIVIDSTTGNNKVYKEFTFSAVTTTKIRVYITASVDGVARLVEVEAY